MKDNIKKIIEKHEVLHENGTFWNEQLLNDNIAKMHEDLFSLYVVSNRRELLIATLHGWQDYKDQGISIEDYVDEIESNL